MVAKADTEINNGDNVKLIGAALLGLAGLIAFYWFADQSLLMRVIGLLIVAGLCAFLVYQTALGKRTVAFFRDARTEVRKVVWPSRTETMQTTVTVFGIVILVGLILWLFDTLLSWLFQLITGI